MITYFQPQPAPGELPERFASPFEHGAPAPLVRRAAEALQERLRAMPEAAREGKMFGVLVVAAPDGRVGWLCGFSGMLAGSWHADGFVPPLFDAEARAGFWPAGEAELAALEAERTAVRDAAAPVRAQLDAVLARHAAAVAEMQARHAERRARRHALRLGAARLAQGERGELAAGARDPLDQESRGDTAERRRLDAAHAAERAVLDDALRALDQSGDAIERTRAERSRALWQRIVDGYTLTSARGETRPLAALFAPNPPPGGAGDCAAPKLLAHAYRHGLRPLGLAELWWGPAPASGGRRAGAYYPACRGKCGPILPFMLDGLPVAAAPMYGAARVAAEPRVVYQDAWLIVVDKPVGLLSVPGRHARLRDSVQTRLGVTVVHRLDLDTSGLLVCARDAATHVAMQRLFARREVEKRYLAWLDGLVAADTGTVELALRVDLDDRPRQIHDPVHGKRAVTDFRVLERTATRTRVALFPRTGRTHQLRVHCAHPLGLAAPVVGDRLYGHDDVRLLLHAESIAFVHPHTGARVVLECPADF